MLGDQLGQDLELENNRQLEENKDTQNASFKAFGMQGQLPSDRSNTQKPIGD